MSDSEGGLPLTHIPNDTPMEPMESIPITASKEASPSNPCLCCIHQNTFFLRESPTLPCYEFMVTMHIDYWKVPPSGVGYNSFHGVLGTVERTICMPFKGLGELSFRVLEKDLIMVSSNDEYHLDAKQLHTMDIVIENMHKVRVYPIDDVSHHDKGKQEGKKAHLKIIPRTTNISGKAFPSASECVISEAAKQARMCEPEEGNINKGHVVNAAGFKGIIGRHSIEIVAATHMTDALKFLERFCNVDVTRPPTVHNVVINARLPHSLSISGGLYYYMNREMDQDCITTLAEVTEMDDCQINLRIHDFDRVADMIEKTLYKEETSFTKEYKALKAAMDPECVQILMKTNAKIKVTHFGAVMIIFSWPKPDEDKKSNKKKRKMGMMMGNDGVGDGVEIIDEDKLGPLPWSKANTKMVYTMVMMVLQLLELCS